MALFIWQQKQFRLALQLSLQCGSRPKSARASPRQQRTQSAPDFIQIGSLSADYNTAERMYTAKTHREVNQIIVAVANTI